MDRGYLGAAKLSGACEPDGKISVETPSAALQLMTPPRVHSHTSHHDPRTRNCQTYDIPFSNWLLSAMLPGDSYRPAAILVFFELLATSLGAVDLD